MNGLTLNEQGENTPDHSEDGSISKLSERINQLRAQNIANIENDKDTP